MSLPAQTTDLQTLLQRPILIFYLFHTLSSIHHAGIEGPDTHELLGVDRDTYLRGLFDGSEGRLKGIITEAQAIVADIASGCGVQLAPEDLAMIAALRHKRFSESLRRVWPKTLDTLDCLRAQGKRLALISNADTMEAAGWSDSPLASRFDQAIFSCHVGMSKPETQIYKHCLERLGAAPDDCVFVGDGGSDEFDGARSAGIPSICTTEFITDIWPEKIPERSARADAVIATLSELCSRSGDSRDATPSMGPTA